MASLTHEHPSLAQEAQAGSSPGEPPATSPREGTLAKTTGALVLAAE